MANTYNNDIDARNLFRLSRQTKHIIIDDITFIIGFFLLIFH